LETMSITGQVENEEDELECDGQQSGTRLYIPVR
jgi:hypothetical protein